MRRYYERIASRLSNLVCLFILSGLGISPCEKSFLGFDGIRKIWKLLKSNILYDVPV